jgi:hypothetical protein
MALSKGEKKERRSVPSSFHARAKHARIPGARNNTIQTVLAKHNDYIV